MGRATWDTGWFQAEIYRQLVQELGYEVASPQTLPNTRAYEKISRGELAFWPNGWFPAHQNHLDTLSSLQPVGKQVEAGALQGVLIDKKTAEAHQIKSLTDLRNPELAKLFDWDGDQKADLIGCDRSWACYQVLDQHLKNLQLETTVNQVSGDYSPLMYETLRRYREGKPVLFYTWTPNWTMGNLKPGEDVVWLRVPASKTSGSTSEAPCVQEPCETGFPPNDIRAVGNADFLKRYPDIQQLLSQVRIPLEDISAQNALLLEGEDTEADIRRHARLWLEEHQLEKERWLASARPLKRRRFEPSEPVLTERTREDLQLTVVVKRFEPFVTFDKLKYSGFALELWEEMAEHMGADIKIRAVNSLAKLMDEVENGNGDVGISGISITSARETRVDFSYPFYKSGLRILVRDDGSSSLSFALTLVKAFFSKGLLLTVGLLILCLFTAANLLWLFERGSNSDFSTHYPRGILDALWWSAVTVTTVGYGDKTPRNVFGKIFAIFWMFAGYFVLAYFTASVSSALTLERLDDRIQRPGDLMGKSVATVRNSLAADYLDKEGLNPVLFSDVSQAIDALKAEKMDAVIFHDPVLKYYVAHSKPGEVKTVGTVFEQQNYGFVLPVNSPHREAVNQALLHLIENGRYDMLYQKWFGNSER